MKSLAQSVFSVSFPPVSNNLFYVNPQGCLFGSFPIPDKENGTAPDGTVPSKREIGFVQSVDMNDHVAEILCLDVFVGVVLADLRQLRDGDGLLRAELQASQTLDAVSADDGPAVFQLDVLTGAQLHALAAADALVADLEAAGNELGDGGPAGVLDDVQRILRRLLLRSGAGQHVLGDGYGLLVRQLRRQRCGHGRDHDPVREQPDAGALMMHGLPVVQTMDLAELMQADAGVACRLAHGKGVGVGADLHVLQVLQKIHRSAAAVAREYESHSLGIRHVQTGGFFTGHDDIRVSQFPGDDLRHGETVAGAGPAENHVFAHSISSL